MNTMVVRAQVRTLLALTTLLLVSACASAAPVEAVRTTSVDMPASYVFEPAAIEVLAGDTVTWTNNDHFSHNVHVLGSAEWRSDVLAPGESVNFTFAARGEYAYQCDLHPQDMTGKVIVAAP